MRFERLERRHAARVFDDLQDPALYAYIPEPRPETIAQLEARYAQLAAGSGRVYEVWHNWIAFDGDTPVGTLQATIYPDRAEVAWVIFARYWRRGFGTAALDWLLHELDDGKLRRVEATIDPRNTASLALAAKLGFHRAGTTNSGDIYVTRWYRDTVLAAWARARAIADGDRRGSEKCALVPQLAALAATDDRDLALLAELLADGDGWYDANPYSPSSASVRELASQELARLGSRAEPAIVAVLGGLDERSRLLAVQSLSALSPLQPASLDALLRMAGNDEAAFAIAELLAKHGVDLAPLLDRPEARLVGLAGTRSLDAHRLVELLGDASDRVRALAIHRLRQLRPRPDFAAPALIARLGDPSREVTAAAAEALGELAPDDARVTRALLDATGSPRFGRDHASGSLDGLFARALTQRPPAQLAALIPELVAWLDTDLACASMVLGALGSHATPDAIAALESKAKISTWPRDALARLRKMPSL